MTRLVQSPKLASYRVFRAANLLRALVRPITGIVPAIMARAKLSTIWLGGRGPGQAGAGAGSALAWSSSNTEHTTQHPRKPRGALVDARDRSVSVRAHRGEVRARLQPTEPPRGRSRTVPPQ